MQNPTRKTAQPSGTRRAGAGTEMEHECNICLVDHDAEIHEATLRLHRWLRDDIERKLRPVVSPIDESKQKRLPRKKAA
jgi:hypothetical protein